MTIKRQFSFLITVIILVPALCMIILPVYHYFTSTQRFLLKEYKEIRYSDFESMTEENWNELKEQILHLPPRVQASVFIDNKAVISTIPDIPSDSLFSPKELFDFIKNTSEEYDYQFQSPYQSNFKKNKSDRKKRPSYILLYRHPVQNRKSSMFSYSFYYPFFIVYFLFETFCIISCIVISRIISSSITMLEQNTKRIADGDLNVELQTPKNSKYTNEITNLTDSLEKMRCSLKEEEERRVRFIMGISHDLRTPVALIKGYTEAISDGVVKGKQDISKSLDIIHSKTEQLEAMINELIDYVKLSSQDFRKNLIEENLYSFLNDYAEGMFNAGGVFKRNFSCIVDIPETLKVPMDKNLISRVLENLISNALRYTKENDSISFSAELINSEQGPSSVVKICIKDTGCGISEEEKEHIFDLFYRASNSRREQGMGIGLAVVKSIIDTHNWTINVESEKDKGSNFIITIPVKA